MHDIVLKTCKSVATPLQRKQRFTGLTNKLVNRKSPSPGTNRKYGNCRQMTRLLLAKMSTSSISILGSLLTDSQTFEDLSGFVKGREGHSCFDPRAYHICPGLFWSHHYLDMILLEAIVE